MQNRPINFVAKRKRLVQLALAFLMSLSAPIATYLTDYYATGFVPNSWENVFANYPQLLIGSSGLVSYTITNELLKKRKALWLKDTLARVSIFYIMLALSAYSLVALNPIESMDDFYRSAAIVFYLYLAGLGISISCVLTGKS